MRICVFSDIHGNLTALEAVLQDAGPVDAYWCLGDLVGYGPDPEACVQRVRQLPNLICLQGNHDAGVVGTLDLDFFNPGAAFSLHWTREHLSPASLDFLRTLPSHLVLPEYRVTLAHGSPRRPLEEYVLTPARARVNFQHFDTPWCFIGHTHLPSAFLLNGQELQIPSQKASLLLLDEVRALLNPGSVGQPRDGDPRAAYAIWDTETNTWTWHRVTYDIEAVQRRMAQFNLPLHHIRRLEMGR